MSVCVHDFASLDAVLSIVAFGDDAGVNVSYGGDRVDRGHDVKGEGCALVIEVSWFYEVKGTLLAVAGWLRMRRGSFVGKVR